MMDALRLADYRRKLVDRVDHIRRRGDRVDRADLLERVINGQDLRGPGLGTWPTPRAIALILGRLPNLDPNGCCALLEESRRVMQADGEPTFDRQKLAKLVQRGIENARADALVRGLAVRRFP